MRAKSSLAAILRCARRGNGLCHQGLQPYDEYGPSTSYPQQSSPFVSWGRTALQTVRNCAMPAARPDTYSSSDTSSSTQLQSTEDASAHQRRLRELLASQMMGPTGPPWVPPAAPAHASATQPASSSKERRRVLDLDQVPMLEVGNKSKPAPVPSSHQQPVTWQQVLQHARREYGDAQFTGTEMLTDTFR